MAKLLTVSEKGRLLLDSEDIFKLSNSLEEYIEINPSEEARKLLDNTFYTVIDKNENQQLFKVISDLYPSSVYKDIDKSWKVGFCNHLTSNVVHCSNSYIFHHENDLKTYLPSGWSFLHKDDIDVSIGDHILTMLFDRLNDHTIQSFNEFRKSNPDSLPKCLKSENEKNDCMISVLKDICKQPDDNNFTETFIYGLDRKLAGNILRNTSFNIFNRNVSVIGPELESLKNIVNHYYNGYDVELFTMSTEKERTYKQNIDWMKQTKLTFKLAMSSQNKNEHNFLKGLIAHCKKFGFPSKILYLGSYPSFWLENISWFPAMIHCYDPKYRQTNLKYVKWHTTEFTIKDCSAIISNTYVYIDIRTDIRGMSEDAFIREDNMITDIAMEISSKPSCSVFFKRKILSDNFTFNDPIYPPDSIHFGKEYYNYMSGVTDKRKISKEDLFRGINNAITENIPHYIYDGTVYIGNSKYPIIGLYSLSNKFNRISIIEETLRNKDEFIITFPVQKFQNWRDIKLYDEPFNGYVHQGKYIDHTISPKAISSKFKIEVVSEEVFVSILDGRINMPTNFLHMVTFKFKWRDFFSDRYFQHIGIRQPSIYARDRFRVSRITAYINRQLTHSSDMSKLEKNNFEGYSGHLIAVEQFFNSLVYTMSPYRWMIRSIHQIRKKETSKYRIGRFQQHSEQEYINTYEYLEKLGIDPLHKKLQ
ncbi:VP3 [Rotavirus I]|uniref:VP3 n=1 Tax=Rotavirus I TaxID=1637496 RepID=A0A0E3GNH8_9REOV|nr:VP3 [Rotavirus I]AKA63275.1 VP3 [Rotavirus I]